MKRSKRKPTPNVTNKRPRRTSNNATKPQINPDATKKTLYDPTTWSCSTTGTTADVWVCLGDGRVVSKGSTCNKGPAYTHYQRTTLSLYMRLNSPDNPRVHKLFFSQATKRYVVPMKNDPKSVVFEDLRDTLLRVRDADWSSTKTKHTMSLGPYLTRDVIARKQRDDRIATAVYTWQHLSVAKCFHSWSTAAQHQKQQRQGSSTNKSKNKKQNDAPIPPAPFVPTTAAPSLRRLLSERVQSVLNGKTGLRNLGNTCYLNSLFQVFVHVPILQKYYSADMIGILEQWEGENDGVVSKASKT